MSRLTDEQLEGMSRWMEERDLPAFAMYCGPLAAAELRARRARDLTAKEREALDRLNRELKLAVIRDDDNCLPHYRTCVALLDRLLAESGEGAE